MWHALDKKEVLQKLKTGENGLSEKEASARLKNMEKMKSNRFQKCAHCQFF